MRSVQILEPSKTKHIEYNVYASSNTEEIATRLAMHTVSHLGAYLEMCNRRPTCTATTIKGLNKWQQYEDLGIYFSSVGYYLHGNLARSSRNNSSSLRWLDFSGLSSIDRSIAKLYFRCATQPVYGSQ